MSDVPPNVASLRESPVASYLPPKIDPDLRPDLKSGWQIDYLWANDAMLWRRWSWWLEGWAFMHVPRGTIPQIEFLDAPDPRPLSMLRRCLERLQGFGMSYHEAVRYVLEWLLYSFGDGDGPRHFRDEINARADGYLYQAFVLGQLQLFPHDYWGRLLAEASHGKRTGFYPTPHTVTSCMTSLACADGILKHHTVCDPCVGTGRMLLYASNHSCRLYAQDIDDLVLKATRANLWLYAPWGARPLPDWVWDRYEAEMAEAADGL